MNELEEIMEFLPQNFFDTGAGPPLMDLITRCVGSVHFQVAERALFLWNNEHLITSGCLQMAGYGEKILLSIYPAIKVRGVC